MYIHSGVEAHYFSTTVFIQKFQSVKTRADKLLYVAAEWRRLSRMHKYK